MSLIFTSCEKCIFCSYDENMIQIGCMQNKLEKINEKKIEISTEKDDKKEWFVLNNHICTTYRSDSFLINSNIQDAIVRAKRVASIRLGCFVLLNHFDEKEFTSTVQSIVDQSKQFHEVVFCISNNIKISDLVRVLNDKRDSLGVNSLPFYWTIKSIVDDSYSGMIAANLCWYDSECVYFSCFESGFIIPKKFTEEIDFALNESLEKFLMLEGIDSNENGLTIQVYIFNLLKGNESGLSEEGKVVSSIQEKIKYIAKDQNLDCMIKRCEDICPSMIQQ